MSSVWCWVAAVAGEWIRDSWLVQDFAVSAHIYVVLAALCSSCSCWFDCAGALSTSGAAATTSLMHTYGKPDLGRGSLCVLHAKDSPSGSTTCPPHPRNQATAAVTTAQQTKEKHKVLRPDCQGRAGCVQDGHSTPPAQGTNWTMRWMLGNAAAEHPTGATAAARVLLPAPSPAWTSRVLNPSHPWSNAGKAPWVWLGAGPSSLLQGNTG